MTNRRQFLRAMAATAAAPFVLEPPAVVQQPSRDPWSELPSILARIRPPTFPARDFDVTAFGAVGDGAADCSPAFRDAIDACARAGGGRVVVPAGVFAAGPIALKSGVDLHVTAGATIRFSRDPRRYPLVLTRFEGMELMNYSPLVYAYGQRDIAVTGGGTLDGGADCGHWWPWKGRTACGWSRGDPSQDADRSALIAMVERGAPVSERVFGAGHYLRPQFIQPYRCTNVLVEGVRLRGAPMWQVHPVLCTNVTVRGLHIQADGPNTDGCDPESCTDVLIADCEFDTGDDCIAIKSGRNADGRRLRAPSEHIVVRGCRMKNGHGGVTIGSEISGGVRNVFAEDCRLDSPALEFAVRVKNNAARGGVIENVFARRLHVGQVARAALTIDFYYEEADRGPFTPVVRNVELREVTTAKADSVLYLRGFPNAPVRDVSLVDCDFEGVAGPSRVEHVDGLSLRNVRVNGKPSDAATIAK